MNNFEEELKGLIKVAVKPKTRGCLSREPLRVLKKNKKGAYKECPIIRE